MATPNDYFDRLLNASHESDYTDDESDDEMDTASEEEEEQYENKANARDFVNMPMVLATHAQSPELARDVGVSVSSQDPLAVIMKEEPHEEDDLKLTEASPYPAWASPLAGSSNDYTLRGTEASSCRVWPTALKLEAGISDDHWMQGDVDKAGVLNPYAHLEIKMKLPEDGSDNEWIPSDENTTDNGEREIENEQDIRGHGRGRGRGRGHEASIGAATGRGRGRGRGRGLSPLKRSRGHNLFPRKRPKCDLTSPMKEVYKTDADIPVPEKELMEKMQEQERRNSWTGSLRAMPDDEYFDAEDWTTKKFSETNQEFVWVDSQSLPFQGKREVFNLNPGPTTARSDMYNAFRSYWNDDILNQIVQETNRHASTINSLRFKQDWVETNIHEILVLLAFWMMLGIIRMPTLKSCFVLNPLLKTSVFRSMFTYQRYTALTRALHFADPTTRSDSESRTFLLNPVLEHLNAAFKAAYIPKQEICIDESLTLWKGKLSFGQYLRKKASRFGIKTFELCESATGYLWSFFVYQGKEKKDTGDHSIQKSTSIVLKIIRPLLGKGYTLFVDNWFNSPLLARFLKQNKTDCVGTLSSTRRDVPPCVTVAPLQQGEFITRHSGDVNIIGWKDKQMVLTLSTYHNSETEQVTLGQGKNKKNAWKPKLLLDYNKNVRGVNKKDAMLEPYLMERKRCSKWYMKLFKRLVNVSVLNARIVVEASTKKQINHLSCRLELIQKILDNHRSGCPLREPKTRDGLSRNTPLERGYSHVVHWPDRLPNEVKNNNRLNRHNRSRCVLCSSRGFSSKTTMYMCKVCKVPLCVECMEPYHQC